MPERLARLGVPTWYMTSPIKRPIDVEDFTRTIGDLQITPAMFTGIGCVIGPGSTMPERAFFTIPASFSTELNQGVTVVAVDIDQGYLTSLPSFIIGNPTYQIDIHSPAIQSDALNTFHGQASELLQRLQTGEMFDFITCCRMNNLDSMLQHNNLLDLMIQRLKPGGYFIASGGFPTDDLPSTIRNRPDLQVLDAEIIPVQAGGYLFTGTNIAFVAQKI